MLSLLDTLIVCKSIQGRASFVLQLEVHAHACRAWGNLAGMLTCLPMLWNAAYGTLHTWSRSFLPLPPLMPCALGMSSAPLMPSLCTALACI